MGNTLYDGYLGPRLETREQKKRLDRAIAHELTERQKRTLTAYYLQGQTMEQIAREQGVNKSTVCRSLHRAVNRLRRVLRY